MIIWVERGCSQIFEHLIIWKNLNLNLTLTRIHIDRVRLPVVFRDLIMDHGDDVGTDRRLVNRWQSARGAIWLLRSIVLIYRYHGACR